MKNRYNELKNLYKDYLIFIKKKDKYKLFSIDKDIYDYLKIKKPSHLKSYNINYIILDNLDLLEKHEFEYNRYDEYYIKVILINAIKKGFGLWKKLN